MAVTYHFIIKILGYISATSGLAGLIFFVNYRGTEILLKATWLVLTLFTMTIGVYLIIKQKRLQQHPQSPKNDRLSQINQLKLTGEKIKLTLENSEVKSRYYQKEDNSNNFPTRNEMLDALYDNNRNHKTKEIQQTYIVFYKQYGDKTYKFISQSTLQSDDVVRRYIDNQAGVYLYIDKSNPSNYYFDLAFV